MRTAIFGAAFLLVASAATANTLRDLARDFKIPVYTANRVDTDLYDVTDYSSHYIVKTRFCYNYATYEDVAVTNDRIYFLDDNEECDIDAIYRK